MTFVWTESATITDSVLTLRGGQHDERWKISATDDNDI